MKTEGEDRTSTSCRLQSSDTTPEETRCTATVTDNKRNGETPIGPSVSGPVVSVSLVNHSSDDCQILQGA